MRRPYDFGDDIANELVEWFNTNVIRCTLIFWAGTLLPIAGLAVTLTR